MTGVLRADADAATDGVASGAPEVRLLSLPHPDYGAALRAGLLAAGGEAVVNFDVDYYDLAFLDRALARLDEADHPAIVRLRQVLDEETGRLADNQLP